MTFIWMVRPADDGFAAVETEPHAQRHEVAGWVRCDYMTFLAAWRRDNARRLEEFHARNGTVTTRVQRDTERQRQRGLPLRGLYDTPAVPPPPSVDH